MEEDENIDEYFQVGVEVGGEEIEWPDHSRHVILIKFLQATRWRAIIIEQMKVLQKYLAHNNPLPSEKVSKFEEGLCLPKIPERPPNSIPKSSMQSRKKVMLKKNFLSQTAQSPEQQQQQEHLHKEVKYMLSPKKMSSSTKRKQSKESVALPEIKKSDEKKNKSEMAKLAKGRSASEGKMNLDRILNDPYLFMQDYFADINTKLK